MRSITLSFAVLFFYFSLHSCELMKGSELAQELEEEIKKEAHYFFHLTGRQPHLEVILVGENPSSIAYVSRKEKACKRCGITFTLNKLATDISQFDLESAVTFASMNDETDGVIVQLPLPAHLNADEVIESVQPEKDVDGLHPNNMGRLKKRTIGFVPATPLGILKLMEKYRIETEGKRCVVVGGGELVGHPLTVLLAHEHQEQLGKCTVTQCNRYTPHLEKETKKADILITAVGKPKLITKEMVKPGAVVIDAGISRDEQGRLVGDVDFETVQKQCSKITPVPGGVGPMTVTALLLNTIKAAKERREKYFEERE